MAASNGQSGEFLDLKELRNNGLPSHLKVKNNVKIKTVSQPSELPTFLPAPTFRCAEKITVLGKKVSYQQNQPSKTFIDGPQLPFFDAKAEEFGVQLRKDPNKAFSFNFDQQHEAPKPASTYTEGEIKYTTKQALKQMTQELPRLNCRVTTGCIVDETCDPEFNAYKEGIHFLTDVLMGHGSYGTVDLCYDSKTRKQFIRKQLRKKDLRTSEIIVPSTLSHCNVTKFFGLIQKWDKEGNPIMELLMEYGGCALNKYMFEVESLQTEQIWDLSKQGLKALLHISHYHIVHLDVKPENICVKMVNGSLLLKLTDFGSSRLPQEPLKFAGVTPEYMAPEMCMMFLQTRRQGLSWGLTEADITGKVDTFAFALVIMYLYKRYHILVKLINNGKTSYEGVDAPTRKLLQMKLMTMMVDNSSGGSLVQHLIPDECDLNMKCLLRKLTEHNHKDRFSAREGLDFIESIAADCKERDNVPVKNRAKGAQRQKLHPYGKSSKKGKNGKSLNSGKTVSGKESKQGIASKQIPMTPVNELEALNLGHCPKPVMENNIKTAVTERMFPVAQESMDTQGCPSHVSQPVVPATFGLSGINTSQPLQQAPGLSFTSRCQQPENNVGAGVMPLDIPQGLMSISSDSSYTATRLKLPPVELIQRLLLMKAAKQAKMTMDTKVQPKVVSQIPTTPREQAVKIGQTKNIAAFDDSPVQMEADDGTGDDGNLPNFSMLN